MNKESTVRFLEHLKADMPSHYQRTGWVVARCPLAPWSHDGGTDKTPAFAIRVEPGDAMCHCFACDFHGRMSELLVLMALRNKMRKAPKSYEFKEAQALLDAHESDYELDFGGPDIGEALFEKKAEGDFHAFSEDWLASFPKALDIPFARQYLADRHVPDDLAEAMDLRADTSQKRVCFPVRNFEGVLGGLHGRAVNPQVEPRYRMYLSPEKTNNPDLWLGEHWVDFTRPIVVVEGPFDLISVARVYDNVVSPLFASPSNAKLKRMQSALEWVTLLDRGTGGNKGRQRISKALKHDHVVTHLLPPEGYKDPGECSADALVDLFAEAGLIPPLSA